MRCPKRRPSDEMDSRAVAPQKEPLLAEVAQFVLDRQHGNSAAARRRERDAHAHAQATVACGDKPARWLPGTL